MSTVSKESLEGTAYVDGWSCLYIVGLVCKKSIYGFANGDCLETTPGIVLHSIVQLSFFVAPKHPVRSLL